MNARTLRTTGSLLLALFAAWGGFRLYSGSSSSSSSSSESGGARLGPAVQASVGEDPTPGPLVVIPERLPDITLGDRDGKPTSLAVWRGKSLIINFWATWCAPCRHEIPLLQALASEWRERDVQVIGIAVDHRAEVLAYARDLKIDYPLLIGEEDALDAAQALGIESPAFPFTVFTDKRGEIVALFVGELHRAQANLLLSTVQSLDQGRLQLPQARRQIAEVLRNSGDVR